MLDTFTFSDFYDVYIKKYHYFCLVVNNPNPLSNMKKCPKCGAELTDDVRYCPFCGAPVTFTEEVKEEAEEMAEEVKEEAEEVKEEFAEKRSDFEEKARETADEVKEKAREAADEVKEAAAKIGAAAKEGWEKLDEKYGDKAREAADKAKDGFEKVMDTPDTTSEYDPADIESNKVLALFAYLGILFLVPLIAAKGSKYARFHTNQGLVLFICECIINFLSIWMSWLGWAFKILNVIVIVLAVLGIINAVSGKAKELPLIGKIRILK